jgi:hypothetical protein
MTDATPVVEARGAFFYKRLAVVGLLLAAVGLVFGAVQAFAESEAALHLQDVSCVPDNCTVRAEIEARVPLSGVSLSCEARKGLSTVFGTQTVEVGSVHPGAPRTLRFGIPAQSAGTKPNRVRCVLIVEGLGAIAEDERNA